MRKVEIWINLLLIASVVGVTKRKNVKHYAEGAFIPDKRSTYIGIHFANENLKSFGDNYEIIKNKNLLAFLYKMKNLKKDISLIKNLSTSKPDSKNSADKILIRTETPLLTCKVPFKLISISNPNKKKTIVLIQHNTGKDLHNVKYITDISNTVNTYNFDITQMQYTVCNIINIMLCFLLKKERLELRSNILANVLKPGEISIKNLASLRLEEKISKILSIVSFCYNEKHDINELHEAMKKEKKILEKENIVEEAAVISDANKEFLNCMKITKIENYGVFHNNENSITKFTYDTLFKLLNSLVHPNKMKIRYVRDTADAITQVIISELRNLEVNFNVEKKDSHKEFNELVEQSKKKIQEALFSISPEYTMYSGLPDLEEALKEKVCKGINAAINKRIHFLQSTTDNILDKIIKQNTACINQISLDDLLDDMVDLSINFSDSISSIKKLFSRCTIMPSEPIQEDLLSSQTNCIISNIVLSSKDACKEQEITLTPEIFQSIYQLAQPLQNIGALSLYMNRSNEVWNNLAFYYSKPCEKCKKHNTFIVYKSEKNGNKIYRKKIKHTNRNLLAFYNAKNSKSIEEIEGPCEEFSIDSLMENKLETDIKCEDTEGNIAYNIDYNRPYPIREITKPVKKQKPIQFMHKMINSLFSIY